MQVQQHCLTRTFDRSATFYLLLLCYESWGWRPKGGKSMLTLSNSRVSWKEGKPMQHWCCQLSSPYFCLYCTCDWHPNSEKTNVIQLCCPAPTDVCTFDIPFLGKPMQLHCWCCLAPTTVCIPEQAFRRSAVQFPRWVIPNRRTMKRDLCPISATSAPNLVEGPFISKTCSLDLWNRNFG